MCVDICVFSVWFPERERERVSRHAKVSEEGSNRFCLLVCLYRNQGTKQVAAGGLAVPRR